MRTPTRTPDHADAGGAALAPGMRQAQVDLRPGALLGRLRSALRADWQGPRFYVGALVVIALSALTVAAFYLNHPAPELSPDSASYTGLAQRIAASGQFMDAERAPGYPALIAVVFAVAGDGNLVVVQLVQGVLFVLTALEAYALAYLILRRSWMACALGLLVGTNLLLLSFVKPLLSEGLTLFLVLTLALALTLLLHSLQPRDLWLVAGCALLLYLTRLEWVYLAAPLFGFVLLIAAQRGRFRALWPHALSATVALYALVGVYVLANGAQTGYRGLTFIQNVNLLGKVMQYHMQNEAPPRYAAQAAIVDGYVQRGITSPWAVVVDHKEFSREHFALTGAYAGAVIRAHPVEFVVKTLPLLVTTLTPYLVASPIAATGPLARPLALDSKLSVQLHRSVVFFPLAVLLLVGLLVWRRTRGMVAVQAAAGVALLAAYDLAITSLGTYTEYPRLHSPFEPLMLLVVWGMVLAGGYMAYLRWVRPRLRAAR